MIRFEKHIVLRSEFWNLIFCSKWIGIVKWSVKINNSDRGRWDIKDKEKILDLFYCLLFGYRISLCNNSVSCWIYRLIDINSIRLLLDRLGYHTLAISRYPNPLCFYIRAKKSSKTFKRPQRTSKTPEY